LTISRHVLPRGGFLFCSKSKTVVRLPVFKLARGNPVIVRVRLPGGITHFVVIAGNDGFDYLIADPGAGAARGLYPLRELGSDIGALRFYEPIATLNSRLSVRR
jgi:hypothetical protein